MVARVLLRMHRRFYDGNKGYLKNLVQCRPDDALPDHFGRLSILHWLNQRLTVRGPAGVNGFHQVRSLVEALSRLGHDAVTIRDELHYLTREQCVVSEHLRAELQDDDLVKITASGVVHLQLMANPEYLAACAEDTYLGDEATAARIAGRCTGKDVAGHFSRTTTAKNAGDLLDYLRRQADARFSAPEVFLTPEVSTELKLLREAEAAIAASEIEVSRRLFVANLPHNSSADDLREAFAKSGIKVDVVTVPQDGARNRGFGFVHVADGQTAMKALGAEGALRMGQRVLRIEEAHEENAAASAPRARATSERVFVGNLPFHSADEATLRRLFADHDLTTLDIHVVVDPASGRSRGYAFVSLRSPEEAQQAIDRIHGTRLQDRALIVSGDTSHSRRR